MLGSARNHCKLPYVPLQVWFEGDGLYGNLGALALEAAAVDHKQEQEHAPTLFQGIAALVQTYNLGAATQTVVLVSP